MTVKSHTFLIAAALLTLAPVTGFSAGLDDGLTPVGAVRAGNAEGTIPEWTGGMTTPPAGYKPGESRIDPFADEKPSFFITADNYQQYEDKLTPGQKALFIKFPASFKMPIYPTHRTAAAPDWVYQNTAKNAASASLTDDGNGVLNAFGGYPFPQPETGIEVIWNHLLRWQGDGSHRKYYNVTVFENGAQTIGGAEVWEDYPYYNRDVNKDTYNGNHTHLLANYYLPIRQKGEVRLVRDPVNQNETPRQAWQYIPGQRRVRRAPTIAFDAPNGSINGLSTIDDAYMFNGSPERFDWKLIGKQEMYVPYNNNRVYVEVAKGEEKLKDIFTPNHMNPEYARWELHRVWVVEATLKDGQRHIYNKRRVYVDEDSWSVLAMDMYDGRNELWRSAFANVLNAYDVPVQSIRGSWIVDFQAGDYGVVDLNDGPARFYEGEKDSFFTPNGIRSISRR